MFHSAIKACKSLLLILIVNSVFATEPFIIRPQDEDILVPPDKMEILEDASGKLNIEDVTRSSLFERNTNPSPYVMNISLTYWIRFAVHGDSLSGKRWVLEALDPHIGNIQVFIPDKNGNYQQFNSGFFFPFNKKKYLHKNFIFDIPDQWEKPLVIYIRIESNNHNVFLFKIRSSNYFTYYALNEYYLLGIFYGILAIMALYNLFLFFSVREKFYLYYVFYVISCGIISFAEDGIGFQYLWPSHPEWNPAITFYSPVFFLLCFTLYSSSFLELNKNLPVFNRVIYIIVFIYSFYFLLDLKLFQIRWQFPIYLLPYTLIYIAAIVSFFKGYRSARFFILGYSFILASIFILIFRMNGLVYWDNIFTVYSFNIGLVLEISIFSFALGDRMRIMKEEKEVAQKKTIEQLKENEKLKDKVNRELEEKVMQRTNEITLQKDIIEDKNKELEIVNEKLQNQAYEIERMNALLYAENKELQVNVKELTKARVMMKEVDFTEFGKIFPDKDSCLKYLSDLKWENGYECRKCKNNKFFEGHESFSRRCTKCGYDESSTAYTIFYRLRFPLEKAFYLLFLVYANKDKITSLELSQILDLRQSTCWSFSKRIMEKFNKRKKHHQDGEIDGWSWLLLESNSRK